MLTKTAIEPIIPIQQVQPLEELAHAVSDASARLSAQVREPLRADLAELTRWMHCYYSNLIEGQQTRVRDIESALRKDFAAEPKKRNLQQLALAHLETQRWSATQAKRPHDASFIRLVSRICGWIRVQEGCRDCGREPIGGFRMSGGHSCGIA